MLSARSCKFLLKLFVGLALVVALLWHIDTTALLHALRLYTPAAFAAGLALTGVSMFIAGLRWKILAPDVDYWRLLKFTLIGQFYSLVLPGQITGDAVKAWRISRGASNGALIAASVLADRIAGLIALLLVSTVGIVLHADSFASKLLWPVLMLTLGLIASLLALRMDITRRMLQKMLGMAGQRVPRARGPTEKLAALIGAWAEATRDPRALLKSLVLGIVFQLIGVAIYAILASCMAIELPWSCWMWISGITAITLLLPITLGGLGVREGTLVAVLAQYSVPGEKAIGLSLGLFALSIAVALAGWLAEMTEMHSTRSHKP